MKRTLLVSYGESSASENEGEKPALPLKRSKPSSSSPPPPPPVTKQQRKRKLPALPAHLAPSVPTDDPSKHQGRTRTTPHVEGQWAAYVYVPIVLRRGSGTALGLGRIVERAVDIAREDGGMTGVVVHSTLGGWDSQDAKCELHISLTRPFFLRAYQREEMKRAVRNVARAHPPFVASFAAFSDLTNDECTRTFLCMEVGAGHQEFRTLSDALTPALRSFRQKEYYEQPRFHASFAWVLLDRMAQGSRSPTQETLDPLEETLSTLVDDSTSEKTNCFPTVPRLPENVVPALNAEIGSQLKGPAGIFDVGEVCIRIGKDVFSWVLSG